MGSIWPNNNWIETTLLYAFIILHTKKKQVHFFRVAWLKKSKHLWICEANRFENQKIQVERENKSSPAFKSFPCPVVSLTHQVSFVLFSLSVSSYDSVHGAVINGENQAFRFQGTRSQSNWYYICFLFQLLLIYTRDFQRLCLFFRLLNPNFASETVDATASSSPAAGPSTVRHLVSV